MFLWNLQVHSDSRPITYIFKTVHPGGNETEEKGRLLPFHAVGPVSTHGVAYIHTHSCFPESWPKCPGLKTLPLDKFAWFFFNNMPITSTVFLLHFTVLVYFSVLFSVSLCFKFWFSINLSISSRSCTQLFWRHITPLLRLMLGVVMLVIKHGHQTLCDNKNENNGTAVSCVLLPNKCVFLLPNKWVKIKNNRSGGRCHWSTVYCPMLSNHD